jgi:hypothetical protein
MKTQSFIVGLLCVLLCGTVGAAEGFSAKRLVYQETTEDVVEYSEVTILRQETGYIIEYREQDTLVSTTHCDSSLAVQRYEVHRDDGTILVFERDGKTINAQDGSTQFTKKIGNEPWNQSISWFKAFLDSDQTSRKFWVVSDRMGELSEEEGFSAMKMKAKKDGTEVIAYQDEKVETIKVVVRLMGFRSAFWKAEYWYRKSDGVMLRYESVHGGPGTPQTVVTLIEEETAL